ncbi:GNAT family N-acetyltransferase [Pontimicrobium sp. SW4]|uniref:GNAT family N-acetyltransferase n=1 Tax=Pontimicrobium sp. SW4 TaxID=3153519 RepID=A0AAU7BS86_9FLAO
MKLEVQYKRAETEEELHQILELQRNNILSKISDNEKQREGFVTVHHTFEVLKAMNDKCPHILAKKANKVIGYALCMLEEFKNDIEVLQPMFQQIDSCLKNNKSYIVMGQICIDKAFRKQGIFKGLYNYMKRELQTNFDLIVTEVDEENTRSLNAHYAVGFKLLHTYKSNQQDWALIYWNYS